MKSWPAKAFLLASAAAFVAAIPALSQEAPESLLPEGFGDPQNLPPPENKAAPRTGPTAPGTPAPGATPLPTEDGEEDEEELDPLAGPRPTN